jgi:predicted nucleic acid-binding protein
MGPAVFQSNGRAACSVVVLAVSDHAAVWSSPKNVESSVWKKLIVAWRLINGGRMIYRGRQVRRKLSLWNAMGSYGRRFLKATRCGRPVA